MLGFPRLSLTRGFQNVYDHVTKTFTTKFSRKIWHPGKMQYDILERYVDISDNIQGKFRNISYEVVVL